MPWDEVLFGREEGIAGVLIFSGGSSEGVVVIFEW